MKKVIYPLLLLLMVGLLAVPVSAADGVPDGLTVDENGSYHVELDVSGSIGNSRTYNAIVFGGYCVTDRDVREKAFMLPYPVKLVTPFTHKKFSEKVDTTGLIMPLRKVTYYYVLERKWGHGDRYVRRDAFTTNSPLIRVSFTEKWFKTDEVVLTFQDGTVRKFSPTKKDGNYGSW